MDETVTTSIDSAPIFYRIDKEQRPSLRLAVCALSVSGKAGEAIPTTKLRWTAVMASRLRAIADQARQSERPEGKSLPYASLRAALLTKIPEAVLLAPDLGAPWKREGFGAVLHSEGGHPDLASRASGALAAWVPMVLRPWAEMVDVDEALVDGARTWPRPVGPSSLPRSLTSTYQQESRRVRRSATPRRQSCKSSPGVSKVTNSSKASDPSIEL